MAITYPLNFPDIGMAQITLRARSVVAAAQSPFTLSRQVQVFDGQRWEADIALPAFDRQAAGMVEAFLLSLNGKQGTFLLGDPMRGAALGVATGTPLVKGAGQTGNALVTDGWTPSTANILRAGDLVQLGSGATSRLHKLLQDANGSGEATLILWPSLRSSPVDNAAVTITNCRGVFALADNTPEWEIGRNNLYGVSLSAVEVV